MKTGFRPELFAFNELSCRRRACPCIACNLISSKVNGVQFQACFIVHFAYFADNFLHKPVGRRQGWVQVFVVIGGRFRASEGVVKVGKQILTGLFGIAFLIFVIACQHGFAGGTAMTGRLYLRQYGDMTLCSIAEQADKLGPRNKSRAYTAMFTVETSAVSRVKTLLFVGGITAPCSYLC